MAEAKDGARAIAAILPATTARRDALKAGDKRSIYSDTLVAGAVPKRL
jgi:hypothetical protein